MLARAQLDALGPKALVLRAADELNDKYKYCKAESPELGAFLRAYTCSSPQTDTAVASGEAKGGANC